MTLTWSLKVDTLKACLLDHIDTVLKISGLQLEVRLGQIMILHGLVRALGPQELTESMYPQI